MSIGTLLIRADASSKIGTGHAMRCLALAQAWQDAGGRSVFAMAETTPAIRERLVAESCEVLSVLCATGDEDDSRQAIALAHERSVDWVVVDGYQFGADYQNALKAAGCKVLFLDDYGHAVHYSADLVLNQNLGATEKLYANRERHSRLLVGPHYCLLRREFTAWRNWRRDVFPVCESVLIMMGGSDPGNVTVRVLEAFLLAGIEDLRAAVVVGGSNPYFTGLQTFSVGHPRKITLHRDVSNIAEMMAEADIGVSATGSTCWEICRLGLPSLLVDVAENQTAVAKEMDRGAYAIRVGDQTVAIEKIANELRRLTASQELRQAMTRRCQELVDGNGARRVVSMLRGTKGWRLRRARADDRRLLWLWANDPEVRAASFSSAPIPWETHVAWFAEKLCPDQSLILIAEDGDATPFGQIRFDVKRDGETELNISLAKEKRGCGLAVLVIEAGVRELFASTNCGQVNALVKPDNTASMRAFEKAGFVRVRTERVRENAAVHFVLRRN